MVIVVCGKDWKGQPCQFSMDGYLEKSLREIKEVVKTKDFDYVSIVCGMCGLGKSNFAIQLAKYCCDWFDEKYIAFSAKQFIDITTNCPNNSSVILDESFASLNSRITMTREFLRIVNHLQIIRQKNLFIFLCLPNYFDLSKGVAIYRSRHLFVVYEGQKFGDRGRFLAFGVQEKKMLYILGQKYMNYHAVKANFRGIFYKQKAIDDEVYKKLKLENLSKQDNPEEQKRTRVHLQRDKALWLLHNNFKVPVKELMKHCKMDERAVYFALEAVEEDMKNESGSIC
jgi:hypothetical protein